MINQKYLTKQAKERGEAAMQGLPEKLFEVYSNTDPYEVYEMQDGSFSVRGAQGRSENPYGVYSKDGFRDECSDQVNSSS